MAKSKEYERLPGKKGNIVGKHTLWLGKDHILSIANKMFVERYKRFYFTDIQAIAVRKLENRKILPILGVLAALFLFLALIVKGAMLYIGGTLGTLSGLLLLRQLLWGDTCESHLITAVQAEKLPSLNRVSKAKKVLDIITPYIEQVQGSLPAEDIPKDFTRFQYRFDNHIRKQETDRKLAGTSWHLVMLGMFLLDAVCNLTVMFYNHIALGYMGTLIFAGLFVSVIVSLVRQYKRVLYNPLRLLTRVALGYVVFYFLAGFAMEMYAMIQQGDVNNSQLEQMQAFSQIPVLDDPVLLSGCILFVTIDVLFVVLGLIFVNRHRNRYLESWT